jgi:hypothetical protein
VKTPATQLTRQLFPPYGKKVPQQCRPITALTAAIIASPRPRWSHLRLCSASRHSWLGVRAKRQQPVVFPALRFSPVVAWRDARRRQKCRSQPRSRTLMPAASNGATLARLVCSMSRARGAMNSLLLALMVHYSAKARRVPERRIEKVISR